MGPLPEQMTGSIRAARMAVTKSDTLLRIDDVDALTPALALAQGSIPSSY